MARELSGLLKVSQTKTDMPDRCTGPRPHKKGVSAPFPSSIGALQCKHDSAPLHEANQAHGIFGWHFVRCKLPNFHHKGTNKVSIPAQTQCISGNIKQSTNFLMETRPWQALGYRWGFKPQYHQAAIKGPLSRALTLSAPGVLYHVWACAHMGWKKKIKKSLYLL